MKCAALLCRLLFARQWNTGKDLAIYTYDHSDMGWRVDNEGEVAFATMAKATDTARSPQAIKRKLPAPGLGLRLGASK